MDGGVTVPVLTLPEAFLLRNATLAHELGRMFADLGLADVQVEEVPIVLQDPTALDNAMGLRDWAASSSCLMKTCRCVSRGEKS